MQDDPNSSKPTGRISERIDSKAPQNKADAAARRKATAERALDPSRALSRLSKDVLIEQLIASRENEALTSAESVKQLQTADAAASLQCLTLQQSLTTLQQSLDSAQYALAIQEAESRSLKVELIQQRLINLQQQGTHQTQQRQLVCSVKSSKERLDAASSHAVEVASDAAEARLMGPARKREKALTTQLRQRTKTLEERDKQLAVLKLKLKTPAAKRNRVLTQLLADTPLGTLLRCQAHGWYKGTPGPKRVVPDTAAVNLFTPSRVGDEENAAYTVKYIQGAQRVQADIGISTHKLPNAIKGVMALAVIPAYSQRVMSESSMRRFRAELFGIYIKHMSAELKQSLFVHIGFDGTTKHSKPYMVLQIFATIAGKHRQFLGGMYINSDSKAEPTARLIFEKLQRLDLLDHVHFGFCVVDSCSTNVGKEAGIVVRLHELIKEHHRMQAISSSTVTSNTSAPLPAGVLPTAVTQAVAPLLPARLAKGQATIAALARNSAAARLLAQAADATSTVALSAAAPCPSLPANVSDTPRLAFSSSLSAPPIPGVPSSLAHVVPFPMTPSHQVRRPFICKWWHFTST